MSLTRFLKALGETGRVRVSGSPVLEEGDLAGAGEVLREFDQAARGGMAHEAPELSLPAALWGAVTLYHGCRFLVFRDIDAGEVEARLSRPCPESPGARTCYSVCYSVDLSLQFLPDLHRLASAIATGDPLVKSLMNLARAWPLSSVGIPGVVDVSPEPFLEHPGLRQLYIDRILRRQDASRLAAGPVEDGVRASLGIHGCLCPRISRALEEPERNEEESES